MVAASSVSKAADRSDSLSVSARLVVKPFQHLLRKDLPHLTVGNAQQVISARWLLVNRQIARHVQQAPDIADVPANFVVCELLV